MQVEYIRNLMSSYMVLEQEMELSEWEREMIQHCNANHMMFAEVVQQDGSSKLWYSISGKVAVDTCIEEHQLKYELLCRMLLGLYETLQEMEKYLLNPDGLVLKNACIFLDSDHQQTYFCYCPTNERNIADSFREWLEELLPNLDHTDEAGVALAYHLYEQAVTTDFGMQSLQEILRLEYEKETQFEVEEGLEPEELLENETSLGEIMPRQKYKIGNIQQKIVENVDKVKNMLPIKWKKKEPDEPFVFEPDEEEEIEQGRPTILLSEVKRAPEGILRYEGTTAGVKDLIIEETPYYIGSDNNCEGQIPEQTVSRRHAKISKIEDIYFIEDLNSTNGTFVGGELLNYKTKMSLERNEMIAFGNEKFRFI